MALLRCPDCGAGLQRVRGRTPTTVVGADGEATWRGLARTHECVSAGCARLIVEETPDKELPKKKP